MTRFFLKNMGEWPETPCTLVSGTSDLMIDRVFPLIFLNKPIIMTIRPWNIPRCDQTLPFTP